MFKKELIDGSLINPDFARRIRLWERFVTYRRDMARNVITDASRRGGSIMTAAYITAAIERYGRVAAFYGVEPRQPFLDRELVEFHAWLPLELRQKMGWGKWALRRAMARRMPDDVAWRPRTGHLGLSFNMAVVRQAGHDFVETAIARVHNRGWLDADKVNGALGGWHERGDARSFNSLHRAAVVALWLRGAGSPVPAPAVRPG